MTCRYFILFVIISTVCNFAYCDDCRDASDEEKLHKQLLCSYNNELRPRKDWTTPVNVSVRMILKSIRYNSEADTSDVITVGSWLVFRWNDDYLRWDPNDYSGIMKTLFRSNKIWTPDFALYNSESGPTLNFETPCLVDYKGNITCIPHIYQHAVCSSSYRDWPRNTLQCSMVYGSWMFKGEEVNYYLSSKNINLDDYNHDRKWKLLNASVTRNPGIYKGFNSTFPTITFKFEFERNSLTTMTLFATPAIVLMILSIISLCIENKSSERIWVNFLNLLCHFIIMLEISRAVPINEDEIPSIVTYFRDSMLLSVIVFIHTVNIRYLLKKKTPVPFFITKISSMLKVGGEAILIFHEFDPAVSSSEELEDTENSAKNDLNIQKEWKKIAFLLNRTVFILTCFVYMILIIKYIYF